MFYSIYNFFYKGRNQLPEEEEKEIWPFQNVFMEEEVLEALDTDNSSEFERVEPDIFSDIAEDILTDFPTCTQPDKDETPLYEGASTNFGTFMLLISLFVSKHNLTGDAVHQLLQIFSYILPESNCVENTLYSFKKYFTTLKAVLKHHRYCPKCLNYVKDSSVIKCQNENCQHSFESITVPYFIEVPILDQLKSLFSQKGFFNSLQGRFCFNESQNSDVYDGRVYKNMFENNGPLSVPENISFILNTDGAPVFKSSSVSVWPLFLTINELSLRQRFMPENMILAGLWFGTLKPAMCTFLKPFVSSMKALSSGIEMYSADRGLFTCKAFLLGVTADLPAKALLCNSVQYNGSFGCWHCLQKGETSTRGKGHVHVFPFKENSPKGPVRNAEQVLKDAQTIIHSKKTKHTVNGIKGPSWLSFCPKFELIDGFAIDYMHGVLLGVQKLLIRLWFTKEFSAHTFNFSKHLPEVDKRLSRICPTLDISRIPRSIGEELKHWKASEYQNFLLYYGVPVLIDILDMERYMHFCLFVNAIHLLLNSSVNENDINRAETLLTSFCKQFKDLYDGCFMTLNIHNLLHLSDQVRNLGPLYTHSCFPFENKNGLILKMIKGTQNIDDQIVTGVSFIQKVPELKQRFVEKGSSLEQLCYVIEFPHVLKRGKKLFENTFILGGTSFRKLSDSEFQSLCVFLGKAPSCDTFLSFNRMELKNSVIYGRQYSRMVRRNNSFIEYSCINSTAFGEICFFLVLDENDYGTCVAFVESYESSDNVIPVDHIISVKRSGNQLVVPVSDIVGLCLVVEIVSKGTYICKFPNMLSLAA